MDKIAQKGVLSLSVLALLCAWLFFFDLGNLPLTDPDETFYAQTAKEMVSRGEWITPYLYGKPQFEKPILFYWLETISFRVFGVNEFAARLPSALFGTLGVLAIYLLGSLLFGRRAGFISALTLATCVEYVILARACITDMVLTVLLLAGFLAFFYGYLRKSDAAYMISAVSLALAVLTKGPAYLLLAVVSIVIFLALNRDLGAILRMPLWKMALAYLAVSAPWYIAIYKLHGKAFVDAFFGFHNVNRFMVAEHKTGSQIYYNLPVLLGGFFPWSVFLPFGLYYVCSKAYGRKSSGTAPGEGAPRHYRMGITFVLVWLTVIFGFFTASSTKLPTYIFPSFISAALITGVLLDDFLGGVKAALTGARISYYALAISIPIGAAIAPIIVNHKLPCAMAGAMTSAAFIAFGMLLSLFSFIIKMYRAAIAFVVYSVAVFIIPLNEMVLPSVERYETSREVSKVLSAMMKPEERLGSESNYLAGLAFYTGKFPVDTDKHHVLTTFMNSAERVWLVMKEKNHKQLYDPAINPTYVVPSYIVYMVGKRAVVTNKVPADGRYISMRKRPDELRR